MTKLVAMCRDRKLSRTQQSSRARVGHAHDTALLVRQEDLGTRTMQRCSHDNATHTVVPARAATTLLARVQHGVAWATRRPWAHTWPALGTRPYDLGCADDRGIETDEFCHDRLLAVILSQQTSQGMLS